MMATYHGPSHLESLLFALVINPFGLDDCCWEICKLHLKALGDLCNLYFVTKLPKEEIINTLGYAFLK